MTVTMTVRSLGIVALLLACGCGDSSESGVDGGGASVDADTSGCTLEGSGTDDLSLSGSCDADKRLGTFLLEVGPQGSFIDGRVTSGILPSSIRSEEMAANGCRLMRKNVPFCDPICGSGETCDLDGECIPYPAEQDLGEVCVAGLEESYVLTGQPPGNQYFNTQIPHPAFSGGERVEMRSAGGVFAPVSLAGVGVTPMTSSDELWSLESGEDLEVTWETSETNAHTEVYLSVNVDQHGTSPLLLECVLPDTGSATISIGLLDALLNSGTSGFPAGRLVRITVDSTAVGDGCMEFVVGSALSMDVRVAGHTPCNGPGQCPSGQTCNLKLETCE